MKVYATTADLAGWMSPAAVPDNAGALLRTASGLVRAETKLAIYTTDADGYPTDTVIRAAFRDATCAQATFWSVSKIDPTLGAAGVTPLPVSKSIGGASISYSLYASTAEARANAAGALSPDAFFILEDAGLLGGEVGVL